ncbi:MAG: RluA family pseudouridine synthase [Gammaproteobacteria bacterium]|nr:RluA family pseudouridine synthase [Gammaproteobacteria bacterium]
MNRHPKLQQNNPSGPRPDQKPDAAVAKVRQVVVDADQAGQRLDNFCMAQFRQVPKSRIYRAIRKGEVRVNGKRKKAEYRLQADDKVRLPPIVHDAQKSIPASPSLIEQLEQQIIFENDQLLVLDKPSGVAVHGGSGVSHGVIEALREARKDQLHDVSKMELVHRLDRDTSGCLLIAKKRSWLRALHKQMRENQIEKRYLALVKGQWPHGRYVCDAPLAITLRGQGERYAYVSENSNEKGAKSARTEFWPQDFYQGATLMAAQLHTGRTHQIRAHAKHLGHPVAGDERYGDAGFNRQLKHFGLRRLFLHASFVAFTDPVTGDTQSFSAPLSTELKKVIDRFEAGG